MKRIGLVAVGLVCLVAAAADAPVEGWWSTSSRQARDLLREHGLTAPVWRRRFAILGGAVTIGLITFVFAHLADCVAKWFAALVARLWQAPLIVTPLGYAAIAGFTARIAPAARGSGIPQVMAATRDLEHAMTALISARIVVVKLVLTV